jgi:small conductance mechanosensitive channel
MDVLSMENLQGVIEQVSAWSLKVLGGIAILVLGMMLARIGGNAARRAAAISLDGSLAEFLGKLARYAIISIIVISVFGIVGIETASLITVLGASSLAIGLALQGSLSNLASGVMLLIFRPFRAGDYVEIGDDVGTVAEIGVFATQLDTLDNIRVVMPNAHVAEQPIRNWTSNGTRRLDLEIEIAVDSSTRNARAAIVAVLVAESRVLEEPAPVVATSDFGDTSIRLVVRPWCRSEDYWALRFELPERVKDAIEAAGCSLPCPQRQIVLNPPASAPV